MSLRKDIGAIAIQGDIYVRNNSFLTLDLGGQIAKTSNVLLQDSCFNFFNYGFRNIPNSQHLNRMTIEGNSVINFAHYNYHQALLLDNLLIDEGALLSITNWRDGFHFLLVRKDSWSLEDALGKIRFEGKYGSAGVRSYDWEYWEIGVGYGFSKLPEPSTYGAIFGGLGVLLALSRKRRCIWRNSAHSRQKRKDYRDD